MIGWSTRHHRRVTTEPLVWVSLNTNGYMRGYYSGNWRYSRPV